MRPIVRPRWRLAQDRASNQEFVVLGYEPSDKRGRLIRSLLLGYDKNGLRYAGRIAPAGVRGGARPATTARRGCAQRQPARKIPPEERRRNVKWVEPRTVVEVDFRGWTAARWSARVR
jgi:bifunctional non-homologous end joining protein LigD